MSKYSKRVEKRLTVDLYVCGDGFTIVEFCENESGDHSRKVFKTSSLMNMTLGTNAEKEVGMEVLSWIPLMEDELDELLEEEA